MNHFGLLLMCLSLASFLAWYSFSVWESAEIWTPRPTELSTGIVMISNEAAEMNHWMTSLEERYESRRQRIQQVCLKYGERLRRDEKIMQRNFIIEPKHKLAYCRHGKVGTSTWLQYFLWLSDLSNPAKNLFSGKDKVLHRIIPDLFSIWKLQVIPPPGNGNESLALAEFFQQNDFMTFSFVRHPFDRLVSAYVDKIREQNDASYYSKIAHIQERYGGEATFPHFVRYILDSPEIKPCAKSSCEEVDAHWRPFHSRCAYCDITYDVIGKMESFEEDVRYILQRQNLTSHLSENGTVFHLHHSSIDDLKKFNEFQVRRTLDFFSELTQETIQELYDLYKVDFEMFDFSVDLFFSDRNSTINNY